MPRLALALVASLALAPRVLAQTRPAPDAPPPASAPAPAGPSEPTRASGAKAADEPRTSSKAIPRGAVLEEVAGTIREVDLQDHRLSLETSSGPVTLSLDRNTMVYTPAGLGTVLDLASGGQVRAGRNADFLAYWVQVRAGATSKSPTAPGQGTGPGGGSGAPPSEAQGTGTRPPAPAGPGGATPPGTDTGAGR